VTRFHRTEQAIYSIDWSEKCKVFLINNIISILAINAIFSRRQKRAFCFYWNTAREENNPKNKRKQIVEISKQLVSRSYLRHRNKFTAGIWLI